MANARLAEREPLTSVSLRVDARRNFLPRACLFSRPRNTRPQSGHQPPAARVEGMLACGFVF